MVFLDYYEVLELPQNADNLDIRKAYRRQALKWHPDKNPNNLDEATQKFKEISEAFQVLVDWIRRRDHDYDLKKWRETNPAAKKAENRPPTPYATRRPSASSGYYSDDSNSDEQEPEQKSDSSRSCQDFSNTSSTDFDPSSNTNSANPTHNDFESNYTNSHPFEFKNPYDLFEEFFGSKLFSKASPDPNKPFSFGVDLNQNHNNFRNWPKPPEYYKNDMMRRKVIKEMTILGLDGSKTILKTKTVTLRQNGKETATVSTGFENGILRTTSIKDTERGSQVTTFH